MKFEPSAAKQGAEKTSRTSARFMQAIGFQRDARSCIATPVETDSKRSSEIFFANI